MANEEQKLAAAALAATAPDPKGWVQAGQMSLAVIALVGALAVAGILILNGPPEPKAATGEAKQETTTTKAGEEPETVTTTTSGVVGASLATTAGEGSASAPAGETVQGSAGTTTGTESSGSSSSEEGESLANLSKQGPWAFAIVALLAAVFLATGKNLSVGGTPKETDPSPGPKE